MDNAGGHFNRGRMLSMKGLCPEAVKAYKKALEIEPGHTQARTNLKLVQYLRGEGVGENRIKNVANVKNFGSMVHKTVRKVQGGR